MSLTQGRAPKQPETPPLNVSLKNNNPSFMAMWAVVVFENGIKMPFILSIMKDVSVPKDGNYRVST